MTLLSQIPRWLGVVGLLVGCARVRPPSSMVSATVPLSPVYEESPIVPPPIPITPSTIYPMEVDLEAATLRPSDFPFMRVLYTIRTEISNSISRGVEWRYPIEEDRYHPFIKGIVVRLQVFQEARLALEQYAQRLATGGDSWRALSTPADSAYLKVRPATGPTGEGIWVHEMIFMRGNLVGYLQVRWSERLDPRFFQERVDLILRRMGR
ncbi:hypothetical protein [Thermoflexus sp.]|uniref:hypothetical protein n=1 Tax=Thermoflexus sp. TaxID=1969742 RepID=UPI0035E3FF97